MALKKKARASEGSKSAKKDAAKVAPKLTRYSKGEHIKVVPLHSPKPTMSIDELSQARRQQSDTDLFDGHTPAAPAPAHLAYFGGPPNVFVVHPSFGAKTFTEFMAKVKDAKQGIEYVSPGLGTGGNMVAEYFKIKSGAKLIHVGYRGGGAAIMDLIAGHVKVGSMTLSTTIPHIRAGSLIPLAVSSAERVPDLPNVPTLKELGYPDLIATTWFSLSGPANLPKEIVDKVNRAVVASLSSDKVQQHLKQEEIQVKPMTPEQLTDFIGSERDKWHPVLAIIGKTN